MYQETAKPEAATGWGLQQREMLAPTRPVHRCDTAQPAIPTPATPSGGQVFIGTLDALDHGVLLVQLNGVLVHANRIARRDCRQGRALCLRGDRLEFDGANTAGRLARALDDLRLGRRSLLLLGFGPTAMSIGVVAVGGEACGAPLALLLMGRTGVVADGALRLFGQQHRLTDAEVEVLRGLSAGLIPDDVAREHGVSLCTVRSQILAVREKTGSRSIRHLLQQVACLPPMAERWLTQST